MHFLFSESGVYKCSHSATSPYDEICINLLEKIELNVCGMQSATCYVALSITCAILCTRKLWNTSKKYSLAALICCSLSCLNGLVKLH